MEPMICAIACHAGDRDQAARLAHWINDLVGVKAHDCLLAIDAGTNGDGIMEPLQKAFGSVSSFRVTGAPKSQWGSGSTDASAPNEAFIQTAWHIFYHQKCPWLWCEPDCCPLRPAWLDEIEAAYKAGGKPFMGARVNFPGIPEHMSGVAVYPAQLCEHSAKAMLAGKVAWDVYAASEIMPKAHWTSLIQHVWRINGQTPEFPDQASLSAISQEACLFHRCKTGSLIDRLREKKGGDDLLPHMTLQTRPTGQSNGAAAFNPEAAPSIAGRMRHHCEELAALVNGMHSRSGVLRTELRKAGLIGSPKKRMRIKAR